MNEAFAQGLAVRREVLGDEFVDNAFADAENSRFGTTWQEFLTSVCWGHVWTRPGLPRSTRSLINIAVLASLGGKDQELIGHIRGAVRNGCSEEEILEVLLQVAIYAGVPAAGAAFRAAEQAR